MSFDSSELRRNCRHGSHRAFVILHLMGSLWMGGSSLACADPAIEEFDSSTPSMLLLHTGRTVRGKITRQNDAYVVRRDNGEMFVPAEAVRLQCHDIKDAYRRLRAVLPRENESAGHIELAQWCLNFQLLGEARTELQDALNLDPTRNDARDLLRRLDAVLAPPPSETSDPASRDVSQKKRSSGFQAEEVESLAGLQRESAQKYMRRIQPILMNNCTLSGCHGPDKKQEFNLIKVTVGSDASRYSAERNLAAVMHHIDFKAPKNSKLLSVLDENHGRRGRPVFNSPRGKEQAAELRAWVLIVAKEQSKRGDQATPAKGRASQTELGGTLVTAGANHAAPQPNSKAPAPERLAQADSNAGETGASVSPAIVRAAGESTAPAPDASDAFDPSVFNRGGSPY